MISDLSYRIRQCPSVWWSINCDSFEMATSLHTVDVQLLYCRANSNLRHRWTAVIILVLIRRQLWSLMRSNFCWTVVMETHFVAFWFIWAVRFSIVERLFALLSPQSLFTSVLYAPHSPHHWFSLVLFYHARYTFTRYERVQLIKLAASKILLLLALKPIIMLFTT